MDVARKVVAVGSVGTWDYVVLLEGRGDDNTLFLQVKEAEASVLETYLPQSTYTNQGQRVVAGQQLMQATSGIFLGWLRGKADRVYYWRQLRDLGKSERFDRAMADFAETYADQTELHHAALCAAVKSGRSQVM